MNRMNKICCCTLILLLTTACNPGSNRKEKAIGEIKATEKAFEQMAASKGIAEAFYFYADTMAVIKRGKDSLIRGKAAIRHFYSDSGFLKANVSWTPDFTEVSEDGKLGYTYGKYLWTSTDDNGAAVSNSGIFHTVWKKQADGNWKYLWD